MSDEKRTLTNPADRVLQILERTKGITGASETVQTGFAKVFGTEAQDITELYRRLSTASQEVIHVDNLLKVSGNFDIEEEYASSKDRISQFFSPRRYDVPWENYKQQGIREADLIILRMCSRLINRREGEKVIQATVLKELLDSAHKMRDEILSGDLPAELKAVLLQNLRRITNAIEDYDVRGVEGLQEAIVLVGFNISAMETEKDSPAWKYVQRIAQIITILAGLAKGASVSAPLLSHMHDAYERVIHSLPVTTPNEKAGKILPKVIEMK